MNSDDEKRLKHIVKRCVAIAVQVEGFKDQIKACTDEHKELANVASERLGLDAKALKQLVAEHRMGAEERDEVRAREAKLDECRHALGLFADTPLGQAAQAASNVVEIGRTDSASDGVINDDNGTRRRGRPKGSRNKPKLQAVPQSAPMPAPAMSDAIDLNAGQHSAA